MIAILILLATLAGGLLLTDIDQTKSIKEKLAPYSSFVGFVLLIAGAINTLYGIILILSLHLFFGLAAVIAGVIALNAGGQLYKGLSFIPKSVDDIIAKITKPVLSLSAPLTPFVGFALLAIAVFYLVGIIF